MSVNRGVLTALGVAVVIGAAGGSLGAAPQGHETRDDPASGASLYRVYCASCHGPSGRGDGPVADLVVPRAPDLTALSRRNGGVFPRGAVIARLDGTKPVASHSAAAMPAWHDVLRATEGRDTRTIRERLNALADHLESLQVE